MITREQLQDNPKILNDLIAKDIVSDLKVRMLESEKYYNIQNSIIVNRKKMMMLYDSETQEDGSIVEYPYIKEDLSRANHKLAHGYHYELVNQCKSYLTGRPVKITYKEDFPEEIVEQIDNILYKDNDWTVFNQVNVKNAQIYTKSWFRVVINDKGKLKLLTLDPKEIIPIYNDFNELVLLIRYFTREEYDEKGKAVMVDYVEVYDNKLKDVYIKKGRSKSYMYDHSEPLLQVVTSYGEETNEIGVSNVELPVIPIIEWKLNDEENPMTMLEPIKQFIDILDVDLSDLANNVDDIQELVWILENYQGQNLSDFMHDLKVKKAIKVGEGGGVSTEQVQIPTDARMKLYDLCERNIYRFGFGIDFSKRENLGNVTGVALKWSYAPLDQKADSLDNQGQSALNKLFSILFYYLNKQDLDSNDVEFIFDKTMISNEMEKIQMVMTSTSLVSQITALENHPLVDDVEEELKRLKDDDEYYGEEDTEEQEDEEVDVEEEEVVGEEDDEESEETVPNNKQKDNPTNN